MKEDGVGASSRLNHPGRRKGRLGCLGCHRWEGKKCVSFARRTCFVDLAWEGTARAWDGMGWDGQQLACFVYAEANPGADDMV